VGHPPWIFHFHLVVKRIVFTTPGTIVVLLLPEPVRGNDVDNANFHVVP
jgi:hypothetical protein